jgi:hypothetical protein
VTSGAPAADIELILDLREYRPPITDVEGFAALWEQLEPALVGRDLGGRPVHYLDAGPDGRLGIEIARIGAPGMPGPHTRFSVVAVRERPRQLYRCRVCEGYGPFLCRACTERGTGDRVCDDHVVVLDGGLQPTCPEHHPRCAAASCATPATFRCGGPSCRKDRAWCDRHRRPHPRDSDTDYCPGCHDIAFPVCEEAGCHGVGTVACEHVDRSGRSCGRRACTRHARRWQVYGAERMGLGLCRDHLQVQGMSLDHALFMIVVASASRRPAMRPPSLAGFGHNLRNIGHREIAVDYRAMLTRLRRVHAEAAHQGVRLKDADEQERRWEKEVGTEDGRNAAAEQIVERLRTLVVQRDRRYGSAIAASLRPVQYKPPVDRPGQPVRNGLLFVDVAEDLRGLFAGKGREHLLTYSAQLGVDVRLERKERQGGERR